VNRHSDTPQLESLIRSCIILAGTADGARVVLTDLPSGILSPQWGGKYAIVTVITLENLRKLHSQHSCIALHAWVHSSAGKAV